MKLLKIAVVFLALSSVIVYFFSKPASIFSSSQTFSWSTRLGSTSDDTVDKLLTDTNGNVYVIGKVTGDADFNADGTVDATTPEESTGYGGSDVYISSYNSSGVFRWAKRFGGANPEYARGAVIDSNNNITIAGQITGSGESATADINGDGDATDGEVEDIPSYGLGFFITSFTSDGTFRWAKRIGSGVTDDWISNIEADSNGNIVIGAIYGSSGDVNGDGDTTDGGAESGLNEVPQNDIVITVFDLNGEYQWSKRLGNPYGADEPTKVKVDSNNNVIVTGVVSSQIIGTSDLNGDGDRLDDGETADFYADGDAFVTSFTSAGAYIWSKRFGSPGDYTQGTDIATTSGGNVTITGIITDDSDLNGDGDTTDGVAETGVGYGETQDIFLTTFDSSGNSLWYKRLGGAENDEAVFLAVDGDDNIISLNSITGDADLNSDGDLGAVVDYGGELSTGYGDTDITISSFDSAGVYHWSKRLGGLLGDAIRHASVTSDNEVVITGTVSAGDADLNGDGDTDDSGGESSAGFGEDDSFISVFDSSSVFQWSERLGSIASDSLSESAVSSDNSIAVAGVTIGDADLNGDGDKTDSGGEVTPGTMANYDVYLSYFAIPVAAAVSSETTNSVSSVETVQIPSSSTIITNPIVATPIKDSNTGGQNVLTIVQPQTFIFDAFLSASSTIPSSLSVNLKTGTNTVLGGGANGILGIKTTIGTSWQVGKVQEMWYKAYAPSGHSPAKIIPELQKKPSIIALSYTPADLIPVGRPNAKYNPARFKIAHSLDGKKWKVLTSSVVDPVNRTVAAIDKVGGYYMIVGR